MSVFDVPRCDICTHALSRHNELGYCQVSGRHVHWCPCDGTSSCVQAVLSWLIDRDARSHR